LIIHSDWHTHSAASYDSSLPLGEIAEGIQKANFKQVGVTDHLNFNDKKFLGDLRNSVQSVTEFQKTHKNFILGVELTPIAKPEFDHIAKTGTRDGYIPPVSDAPYDIELALTKEELKAMGIRYAIGAAHWRVDVPHAKTLPPVPDTAIKEWHRQQLWLACDERVTILGHPWYNGKALWYEDFTAIPRSMNAELAAALKENNKYVECNSHFFNTPRTTERFRRQYAEFLRELHEMGIPVTYGSDAHNSYEAYHIETEKYLVLAGFKDGDIAELREASFWFLSSAPYRTASSATAKPPFTRR